MTTIIKRDEAIPATYPAAPSGLSAAAAALDAAMIWQRIESYVAHRWTARPVIWTVQGCGDWQADLTPATVSSVDVWTGDAWAEAFPAPSPLGGFTLAGDGPYRLSASVGGGTVPAAVSEAFRRLAEYMAETDKFAGAGRYEMRLGELVKSVERNPAWKARAMVNSGAGDLLRPYRKVW